MPGQSPCLLVFDVYNLVFRAFYALPPMTTATGTPTNAVLGVANMVLKLLEDLQPDAVAAALDPPTPSFRHQEYAEYKATRQPTPEDLIQQFPLVREFFDAMNIPQIEVDGYEADDVLGALAARAPAAGMRAVLVTGDKDAYQLVNDQVSICISDRSMRENTLLDAEGVREKLGVRPDQVADLKALSGDPSDNIPGVRGIGPKRALKLLSWAEHIEDMLARPEAIEDEKLRAMVVENAEELLRWKRLCVLKCDMPLPGGLVELSRREPDLDRLGELFSRLQLYRLAQRLGVGARGEKAQAAAEAAAPAVRGAAGSGVDAAREAGRCALHAALRGTALVGLGLSVGGERTWHFDLGATVQPGLFDETAAVELPADLAGLLADAGVAKCCYDAKSLERALAAMGVALAGVRFDALLAGYLLSFGEGSLGLSRLAQRYLERPFEDSSGPEGLRAGALAVDQLERPLREGLEREGLTALLDTVELPLSHILAKMELTGVCVDRAALRDLSEKLAAEIRLAEEKVFEHAGERFVIGSPKQLQYILFEKLKLPQGRKTKTGFSTDADVLSALAEQHEIVRHILDYRTYAKLKSTYADALADLADPETGRVHTRFNQATVVTGRLSSSEPNLQNIPVRTEWGQKVRRCFVAPDPGTVLLACDYSQIELRVLAHFSKDEALCSAFGHGEDIHTRTAANVFGVELADVTQAMRGQAKTVNFGIIYGMGIQALARDLGVSKDEAADFMERYFRTYAGVKAFIDETIARAKELGYVTTLLGRKRTLPELASPRVEVRRFGERTAVNTPIQGTAADMIKKAMIDVDAALAKWPEVRMILQVHDELLFELPERLVNEVAGEVCRLMAGTMPLDVPVVVDAKVGPNWGEMEPLQLA
ncbi:MAG TPA: DNA polymerase I [Armatimonadota bacterium]|nr:DNA polymerase I [Armatimonadota bacterium]